MATPNFSIDDTIRARIAQKLELWVAAMPDEPIVGAAGSGQATLTPRQLLEHVQRKTPLGESFVKRWLSLAVTHIMDSQLR
jgi:hypothetical protein